ncbi:HNH endonuclease [Cellulomonas wangsupingiae]|uniref:HNH endonuclease n=1 Tax=Cellulomonas wangsupingiae TaxID=2968085 RepID=UPI001D0DD31F|nr:HNH endonuclease signature motif containing protein [Cellulomonas wangsupingiae]MCM0639535.1 HNH endonuclease [Cellulomonas wangsupingiae]
MLGDLVDHVLDGYDANSTTVDGDHVVIARGRRYDADKLEAALQAATSASELPLRPSSRLPLLEAAGFRVLSLRAWSIDDELLWRMSVWRELQRHGGLVPAQWLRARGVYGGGQGIYVDKQRTRVLAPTGLAVSVLSTGRHYSDQSGVERMIYSFPMTRRPAGRDRAEIDAVSALLAARMPLFVIENVGAMRRVRLAWVTASAGTAQSFLLEFAPQPPPPLVVEPDPQRPFDRSTQRRRRAVTTNLAERDAHFTYRVLHRYEARCAVTGVPVKEVLDAAHVIPVADGGPDDERNGILLTATLHRAFDAGLWALNPVSGAIELDPRVQPADLRLTTLRLRPGAPYPHAEAMSWRYSKFRHRAQSQA